MYDVNQVSGNYKLINHGLDITEEINTPIIVKVEKNGNITGDILGEWNFTKDMYANIILDETIFKGVFISQWNEYQKAQTMAFSGISNEGESIFMVRIAERGK